MSKATEAIFAPEKFLDLSQTDHKALFENATNKYSGSRFVVTTRPQSYAGRALLAGFHEARIEPLAPEAVHTFLDRWCRGSASSRC